MPTTEPALPDTDEGLVDLLLDLAVPHEDVGGILALRRRMAADAELRSMSDTAVKGLTADMGQRVDGEADERVAFPGPPDDQGAVSRYLPVYVYLTMVPVVRAYHRDHGVPEAVSRHTLADLGRQMAVHRRRCGMGGLTTPGWLALHFRGELYQLGRLQYQRSRLDATTAEAIRAAGVPADGGDLSLSLHIPDFRGPLTPEAVDRSLAEARAFFARHFPEDGHRIARCFSWLLDPQLTAYLPETSNIIRFQSRFRPLPPRDAESADQDPVGFVFGDPELPVDRLPRRTTLERAVGDHLRSGGHWHRGHGWFEL